MVKKNSTRLKKQTKALVEDLGVEISQQVLGRSKGMLIRNYSTQKADMDRFICINGVAALEFPNVLVVLSGGWNQYNWPRLLEQVQTGKITAAHRAGYYRARNLFYVALSRPKKRLAVLATQELNADALLAAEHLFTPEMVLKLPFGT